MTAIAAEVFAGLVARTERIERLSFSIEFGAVFGNAVLHRVTD